MYNYVMVFMKTKYYQYNLKQFGMPDKNKIF